MKRGGGPALKVVIVHGTDADRQARALSRVAAILLAAAPHLEPEPPRERGLHEPEGGAHAG